MRGEYFYNPETWKVTDEMMKDYQELGYILVRNMFSPAEIQKIDKAITRPDGIQQYRYSLDDGEKKNNDFVVWSHPGNDVTGMVGRCARIVDTSEILMGGKEIYHYHTKIIMKEPKTGGKFQWHQDYGYWYKNGCLRPDLNTAYIAVDKSDKSNGCLQVIPGSHLCGRIDHVMIGGQTGADMERVNQILNFPGNEKSYVELNPGDTLIFHSNLLHTSAPNESDRRRWAFLASYNRADNNPVYVHHHAQYTPLHKVPDSAILECEEYTDMSGKEFMDPAKDKTIRYYYDSTKDQN